MMLIETRVANEKKSTGLAYVLWFFLGGLGIHNLWLGRQGLAALQLLGGPISVALIVMGILGQAGSALMFGAGLAGLVLLTLIGDLFFIPSRVRAHAENVRSRISEGL